MTELLVEAIRRIKENGYTLRVTPLGECGGLTNHAEKTITINEKIQDLRYFCSLLVHEAQHTEDFKTMKMVEITDPREAFDALIETEHRAYAIQNQFLKSYDCPPADFNETFYKKEYSRQLPHNRTGYTVICPAYEKVIFTHGSDHLVYEKPNTWLFNSTQYMGRFAVAKLLRKWNKV